MNSTVAVNFESFYFFELLQNIRRNGREQYSGEDQPYLEKVLLFLESENDASTSIEKLAASQNTSDLAIFFSDILEHLQQQTPEAALEKMSGQTTDFLEIFTLFLQSPEWKHSLAEEIGEEESVHAPADPALSIEAFCKHYLQEKIRAYGDNVMPDLRHTFTELALTLVDMPRRSQNILVKVDSAKTHAFVDATLHLMDVKNSPQIDNYVAAFNVNADAWVEMFADIFQEFPSDVSEALHRVAQPADADMPIVGSAVIIEDAEADQPFEALFDQAEEAVENEAEESQVEAAASELDELVENAGSLDNKKIKPSIDNDEERERKQFLRDYVVGEVESYAGEILGSAANLTGEDNQGEQVRESLKGLKDLGQIHSYPVLEQAADSLLQVFVQLQQQNRNISEEDHAELGSLFKLFPDYIDAVIQGNSRPHEEKILDRLAALHATLFDADSTADLNSPEILEGTFQDVVQRYATHLDSALGAPLTPAIVDALTPVFSNLSYWTETLGLNAANNTVSRVRELLTPDMLEKLSETEKQMISDIIKSWQSSFVTTPEEVWQGYLQQLNAMPAAVSGETLVGIEDAAEAFKAVAERQISTLRLNIESADTDQIPALLDTELPALFTSLESNSQLLNNAGFQDLFSNLQGQLNKAKVAGIADKKRLQNDLSSFLTSLLDNIRHENTASLPEAFSRVLDQSAPAADSLNTLFDQHEEDEIMDVFRAESQNYITELNGHLKQLRENLHDETIIQSMGVTTHTLKGSAQMVGRNDIAELAEPMDKAIDLIESKTLRTRDRLVDIFQSFVDHMDQRIGGKETDANDALSKLSDYISTNASETPIEQSAEQAPIPVATPPAPQPDDDEPYIHLNEQDPELLDIFKNEVVSNFDVVEKHLANLEKFTYDKEALQQVERSVHEIRGAAKMLGISEIATLTDQLEQIFEMLIQQKIEDFKAVIPITRRAMHVIRELTTNHHIKQSLYDDIQDSLTAIVEQTPLPDSSASPLPAQSSPASSLTAETPVAGTPVDDTPTVYQEPPASEPISISSEEHPPVDPQVLELYLQEAHEQMEDIDYLLLKLERDTGNEEMQHHLMRCMHTLKGSSGMVYATHIEALSHRCEDILEKNIKDKNVLSPELFDLLSDVMNEITFILNSLRSTKKESIQNYSSILNRLEAYFSGAPIPAAEEAGATEEATAESAAPAIISGTVLPALGSSPTSKKDTYLRLNINKMNHLLNLAAELVISNNQFKNQLDRLKNFIPMLNSNLKVFRDTEDYINTLMKESKQIEEVLTEQLQNQPGTGESLKNQQQKTQRVLKNIRSLQDEVTSITHTLKENSKTYDENLQKLNKLSNELLDEIMQARLVPINMLFQRFHRPIRDLARQLKKQIRLSLEGENTELDRTLVDELYEPLLHIIRNAIDHGIETAADREKLKKNPEGLIKIKAYRDRNQVIIEISDDGRGINPEQIKKSAVEKGLLSAADAKSLKDQELFEYLFYPGFSTATETTLVSGRGVGLDAVKTQIEKAKGDIRMYSNEGKGTTFSIRVPISLSVIQSMLVDVSGHVYSIPLLQVEETLNVNGKDIITEDNEYFIRYRENKIQVVQLSHLLSMRDANEKTITAGGDYPLIMVQDEGVRVALMVDKIIRREEILIKSLGPGLRRLKFISGGSIMADGQVVLVLDIPQVIQSLMKGVAVEEKSADSTATVEAMPIRENIPAKPARPKRIKKTIEGRKPVALIVDDSLSIRKYLSSLLMQKGYITDTARNGYEALELLNKQEFDIMVTDLEMPKLSGYELIETLRYDQRFAGFPIIVLTGRAGENFRQLTNELGADAYIIKPFKDRELFDQIEKFIDHKDKDS